MFFLVAIISSLLVGYCNAGSVVHASFRACPGSCGTIWCRPTTCIGNINNLPAVTGQIIRAVAWSFFAGNPPCPLGWSRGLLRFDQMTSTIPQNAIITSATLKLFGAGLPQVNPAFTCYPASPYNAWCPNTVLVHRVTSSYSISNVTCNTQPTISNIPVASIPSSNVPEYYNVAVDVTSLVQSMISSGVNHGFLLRLQTEQRYRAMNFFSCDANDCELRPLLEVDYIAPCPIKRSTRLDLTEEKELAIVEERPQEIGIEPTDDQTVKPTEESSTLATKNPIKTIQGL